MKLIAAASLALALAGCSPLPRNDQDAAAMLVGKWYGEMPCSGDCGKRDYLRWTRVNFPDGAQRVHFRYYWKGAVSSNVVRTGRWGYEGGIYWLTCETFRVDGSPQPCPSARYEFVVEAMTRERMTYWNERFRVRYRTVRVAEDFELKD